jgi:hypothetical protein
MTRMLKLHAVVVTILGMAFCAFFQVSKHGPAFRSLNPFGEDPYDSVGSFGVQFVLFLSVLSIIRAFRPHPKGVLMDQQAVLARGEMMVVIAVGITLVTDLIAMVRHTTMWVGSTAGYELGWMALGLFAVTVIEGWYLYEAVQTLGLTSGRHSWKSVATVCAGAGVVVALYPESLRHYLFGELFTVLVGIAVLFVPIRVASMNVVSEASGSYTDSLDDVAAVYSRLKVASPLFSLVCDQVERILDSHFIRAVVRLLNPRQNRWNLIIASAILIGAALLIAELREPGSAVPTKRLFLLIAVYVGLETAGFATGYALLSKPLRLFSPMR